MPLELLQTMEKTPIGWTDLHQLKREKKTEPEPAKEPEQLPEPSADLDSPPENVAEILWNRKKMD